MKERDNRPGEGAQTGSSGGDIRGPTRGDFSADPRAGFTDWDNPEDAQTGGRLAEVEDAPEGYYDDEDEPDDGYIPTPDDPDYDLSEEAGYSGWEDRGRRSLVPAWLVVAVSLLLILALLLPALIRFN
jgi:hypothetical protein